jgi:hypothetical protein
MYYQNLSGTGQRIQDSGDPDLALFPTLQSTDYWSGTGLDSDHDWLFDFGNGHQLPVPPGDGGRSWAVHAGNVSPVPLPPALYLFGSGLIGLVGMARRKAA